MSIFVIFLFIPFFAFALNLDQHQLQRDYPVREMKVLEPHNQQILSYRGYAILPLLKKNFARQLKSSKDSLIIFTALDGYKSVIPFKKFQTGHALLAFERTDGKKFQLNNLAQNESNVALGPFYLVWNDHSDTHSWPYQVTQIEITSFNQYYSELIPKNKNGDKGFRAYLNNCSNCHKLKGLGGDKGPELNLELLKQMEKKGSDSTYLIKWISNPRSISAQSNMPALQPQLSKHEKKKLAKLIADYLQTILKIRHNP